MSNHSSQQLQATLRECASLLRQNRPNEAVEKLLPFYETAPNDPDIAINLGGAYILQGQRAKALSVLEPAANQHEENAMLWTNLGAAYLGHLDVATQKHQEQAIQAYERALQADPEAPNVHYHLGLLYKKRKELNRAMAFFVRALEVNPADQDASYWIEALEEMETESASHSNDKQD